jgi:hypothetical protein
MTTTAPTKRDTKRSRFLDGLASELETRLATGDLRGFAPAQLERAANLYRYQAEAARRSR